MQKLSHCTLHFKTLLYQECNLPLFLVLMIILNLLQLHTVFTSESWENSTKVQHLEKKIVLEFKWVSFACTALLSPSVEHVCTQHSQQALSHWTATTATSSSHCTSKLLSQSGHMPSPCLICCGSAEMLPVT